MQTLRLFFLRAIIPVSLIYSQTKEYNIKDIVQKNGVYYSNYTNEKVNGFVFQLKNNLNIPVGMLIDGKKQGKWVEWSEREVFKEKVELENIQIPGSNNLKKNISKNNIISRETREFLVAKENGIDRFILISTHLVFYDSLGSTMEELFKYYDSSGKLQRQAYRKFIYNFSANKKKLEILTLNDRNLIIQKQNLKYNEQGKLLEQTIEDSNGLVIKKISNHYDAAGKLLLSSNHRGNGEKIIKYFYDDYGKKINEEYVEYLANNKDFRKVRSSFYYDKNDKLIKIENNHFRILYSYDSKNNLKESNKFLKGELGTLKDRVVSKTVFKHFYN